MIERRINEEYHSQPHLYLEYLINQMKTTYAKNISDWTQCPSSDESRYLACSTSWISEDATLNCQFVYRDEDNQKISQSKPFNLGQIYYSTRMPILEQRLIQAGVRLATVINKIVQSTDDDTEPNDICFGSMMLITVVLIQSILILALLSYTFLRRKPTRVIIQAPVMGEKKDYLTIA